LTPNATRVLIKYGLEEILLKKNVNAYNTVIHTGRYDTGEILDTRSTAQSLKIFGFPSWNLARYTLQETLAAVAQDDGVTVLFDRPIIHVDLEKPAVFLKDGTIIDADLIIGADGTACLPQLQPS
jgi:salicylate hydroxylase